MRVWRWAWHWAWRWARHRATGLRHGDIRPVQTRRRLVSTLPALMRRVVAEVLLRPAVLPQPLRIVVEVLVLRGRRGVTRSAPLQAPPLCAHVAISPPVSASLVGLASSAMPVSVVVARAVFVVAPPLCHLSPISVLVAASSLLAAEAPVLGFVCVDLGLCLLVLLLCLGRAHTWDAVPVMVGDVLRASLDRLEYDLCRHRRHLCCLLMPEGLCLPEDGCSKTQQD